MLSSRNSSGLRRRTGGGGAVHAPPTPSTTRLDLSYCTQVRPGEKTKVPEGARRLVPRRKRGVVEFSSSLENWPRFIYARYINSQTMINKLIKTINLRSVKDKQCTAFGPRSDLELGSWWVDTPHGWGLNTHVKSLISLGAAPV